MVLRKGFFKAMRTITVTISAVTNQANIRALAGNPADAVNVIVNVNAVVYSSTATVAALVTGAGWAAGSKIKIVNNSTIYGCGGAGGTSGVNEDVGWDNNSGGVRPAAWGGSGGAAIEIQDGNVAVSIDNTNGFIYGGGGGGGGGATGSQPGNNESLVIGGTGGVGRSYNQSAGAGGNSYLVDGSYDSVSTDSATYSMGGAGGDYGAAGSAGHDPGTMTYYYTAPSAGGAGGKAVALGGHSVTWIAGNDTTKIKGAVA